jgi:hypothetical protein
MPQYVFRTRHGERAKPSITTNCPNNDAAQREAAGLCRQRLHEVACFSGHEDSFDLATRAGGTHGFGSGNQLLIACISAEILMVAKLEKVSDTA